jgi:hypothetical protein
LLWGAGRPGDGAVEEKAVPLDRGPDGGRDNGAAKLDLMFGRGEGKGVGSGQGHELCLCCGGALPKAKVNYFELFGEETCGLAFGFHLPGYCRRLCCVRVKHVTFDRRIRRYRLDAAGTNPGIEDRTDENAADGILVAQVCRLRTIS